jgi:hypothetical protein
MIENIQTKKESKSEKKLMMNLREIGVKSSEE